MSKSQLSEAKLAANRANAQRSTGPRTEEGKRRSSMNAARHGLFARNLVLPDDNAAEFQALQVEMIASYQPQNLAEMCLVEQIVAATWRLRRVLRCEREMFKRVADESEYELNGDETMEAITGDEDESRQYQQLTMIEQRAQGSIARAHRELERLRKLRRQQVEDEQKGLHGPSPFQVDPESVELEEENENENVRNEATGDVSEGGEGSCAQGGAERVTGGASDMQAEAPAPATSAVSPATGRSPGSRPAD